MELQVLSSQAQEYCVAVETEIVALRELAVDVPEMRLAEAASRASVVARETQSLKDLTIELCREGGGVRMLKFRTY